MEGTTAPETESSTMSLATIESAHGLTREQIQLIKDTIAAGATDEELRHFVAVCNRLNLDPFAKQIYLVRRYEKEAGREIAKPQVGIDGFRVVAERTGQYRGQTPPQWCGRDEVWRDVWLSDEPPAAARVGVHRTGFAEPLFRTARYGAYVQTYFNKEHRQHVPTRMWLTMPDVMLAKCAESLALRAAFPNHLSGVYTTEEMGQASNAPQPTESFPLASLPAPEAQQRPQEAVYEPPASERRPAVVVPFRAAQQAPRDVSGASEPDPVVRTALQLFGPKLRTRMSRDELVGWMRQVIAHDFEPVAKRALFGMWSQHVRACLRGEDPNVLLAEAKRS